jgi:gliding motility-associated-like protein
MRTDRQFLSYFRESGKFLCSRNYTASRQVQYDTMNRYLLSALSVLVGMAAASQADFAENRGQWPPQVRWRAQVPGGALWVESGALTWQFFDTSILEALHPTGETPDFPLLYREHSYNVRFVGSSPPEQQGEEVRPYYHNYYLGNDSASWATHVPVYGAAEMRNIYPATAVRIYSRADRIKYDFILEPGADPGLIRLNVEGASAVTLDRGELVITTTVNEVREQRPFAYQIIRGRMTEVPCEYVLTDTEVSFRLGRYDPAHRLVIDPEIAFSTFIGSTASNFGFTACDDLDENLISGAAVFAQNYPVTAGAIQSSFSAGSSNYMDVAISKFSPEGNALLYSTYLGGGRQETPHSLVTDSQNNIILMGVTGSNNFPVTAGVFQNLFQGGPNLPMNSFFTSSHPSGCDFFITKLSSAGAMLHSTYAGGSSIDGLNISDQLFYNYGDAFRGQVNVDASDNIFVASVVRGNFPLSGQGPQSAFGGGDSDGIVMKFNPQLSAMLWGSYIGGNGSDACYAIEFEENGNILIAGGTRSANFPHTPAGHDTSQNGQCDGFLIKINPVTFAVMAGTFVGTTQYDQVYFIQTDLAQNIYVLGQTRGTMPITPGLYGQPNSGQFIRKFNNALTTELWTTRIGTGSGHIDISPTAFLVSDCGQIYFSGWGGGTNSLTCQGVYSCYATNSTTQGLPITSNAFQSTTDGSDFYLCVLSQDATSLVYGSYLGGSESNEHVDGGTSRFNKNGSVYQAVCAGCQGNSDFPTTPGAWSAVNPSFGCNLAVFRFNLGQATAQISIDGPSEICVGTPAQFMNDSQGANVFEWSFGDGSASGSFAPLHVYNEPGVYSITLVASDELDCVVADTAVVQITILPGVDPVIDPVDPVCVGQQVQLNATGSPNLYWLPHPTLSNPAVPNPVATPSGPTTYYVVDSNLCDTDTVGITVTPFMPLTGISPDQTICTGSSVELSASGGATYQWSPPEGLSSTAGATVIATPAETTLYSVEIVTGDGCVAGHSVLVTVFYDPPGGTVYPDIEMCAGSSALLQSENGLAWSWTPAGSLSDPGVQNPVATPADTTTYFVSITNSCGTGTSEVTVNVLFPEITAQGGGTICLGRYVTASASGGIDYSWSPASAAFPPDAASTILIPQETTLYTVTGIDENGCADEAQVLVTVLPLPQVNAGPDQYFDYPGTVVLFGNTGGLGYSWTPPDHLSCTDCPYPEASPPSATWYTLSTTDAFGCTGSDSVLVRPYYPLWVPNTITPNNDGINDYFQAYGIDPGGFRMQIYDRWGILVFESDDPLRGWDGGIGGYYVQNDTYVWVIEYETLDRRERLVGHVNVIR